MDKIITLVFGGSTNALGQIRASHQAGYECINVVEDCMHSWSRKSKYCKGIIGPHPYNERKKCIEFVLDIISKLKAKPFLFFASDDWMDMVGANEDIFREVAYLPQTPWNEMSYLYNKKYLYRIAEENGIPYPRTIEVETLQNIPSAIEHLSAPYILKPQTTVSQNEIANSGIVAYHRTQTFDCKENALEWVRLLLNNKIDFPVIMQEFIPGDATKLYTLTSYSNKDGKLIAGSVGHKLRQFPPVAGRITSGVLMHDQELYNLGEIFLKKIKFHGLANTEFKLDERDGRFKLMEINTRLGAWNYSTLYSGLNLVKVAVEDTLGVEYNGQRFNTDHDGAVWYNLMYDLASVLYLNKKIGEKDYSMSFHKWKESLGEKSFEAVWDRHDMKPFIFEVYNMIKRMIKM